MLRRSCICVLLPFRRRTTLSSTFSEPFNRTSNTAAPTAECQRPLTAAVYFKTLRLFLQCLKETAGKHHGRGSY
ncbi:hypothetical protein HMPREF3038_02164 [Akkermansia sp. KLE1797]|nr:hypothetical protein HMPREF3038_02164 [Akkermansia sp. KLE1797]KXU53501.1 hypothetical protein HMPREF3039_02222 [Akkermansia sp. KLE1798]KZA05696.1 hypothetical protein HMPREF1326_00521 [Akkermansia sp. KLE1605]